MKKTLLIIGILSIVLICSLSFFACKDNEGEPSGDPSKMTKLEFAAAVNDLNAGDYHYMYIYYETDYRSSQSGKVTKDSKYYAFRYNTLPEGGIMNWEGLYTHNGSIMTKYYWTNTTNYVLKRYVGMTAFRDVNEYVGNEKPTYSYYSDEYTFHADKENGEYQIIYRINLSDKAYNSKTRDFDAKGRLTQFYSYESASQGSGIYRNEKYTIRYFDTESEFNEWKEHIVISEL